MNQGGCRQQDTNSPAGASSDSAYNGFGHGSLKLMVAGAAGCTESVVPALLTEAVTRQRPEYSLVNMIFGKEI